MNNSDESTLDAGDKEVDCEKEEIWQKCQLLKTWLLSNENKLPSISDKTVNMFLHSCYYDVDHAKRSITSYYDAKIKCQELFHNRNPLSPDIKTASEIYYCILLPGTTDEGYKVIMMGHRTKDVSRYKYQDVLKLFLMAVDMWLSENELCSGYLFAIDCKNTGYGHFSPIPFSTLAKICSYFQNSLPIRLQGLILINVSPAVNMLIKCLRILLSKRLANMIYQYTEGSEKLFERIPKKILPLDVGGDCGSISTMNDVTYRDLCDYVTWFQDEEERIKIMTNLSHN